MGVLARFSNVGEGRRRGSLADGRGAHARPKTTPVHHAARRRGCRVAARGARAAMAKTRVGIKSIQPRTSPIYAAFDQRLREPGYIEGQNLIADFLNPEDQAEGIAAAIKEAGFGGKSMSLCPTSDI